MHYYGDSLNSWLKGYKCHSKDMRIFLDKGMIWNAMKNVNRNKTNHKLTKAVLKIKFMTININIKKDIQISNLKAL